MPILMGGIKYACEPCMRGHRSSKCNHWDRVLIKVRKPGRPLANCPHGGQNNMGDARSGACDCGKTEVAIPKFIPHDCLPDKLQPNEGLDFAPHLARAASQGPSNNAGMMAPPHGFAPDQFGRQLDGRMHSVPTVGNFTQPSSYNTNFRVGGAREMRPRTQSWQNANMHEIQNNVEDGFDRQVIPYKTSTFPFDNAAAYGILSQPTRAQSFSMIDPRADPYQKELEAMARQIKQRRDQTIPTSTNDSWSLNEENLKNAHISPRTSIVPAQTSSCCQKPSQDPSRNQVPPDNEVEGKSCSCGDNCACFACRDHLDNETMRNWVSGIQSIPDDPDYTYPVDEDENDDELPLPLPHGFAGPALSLHNSFGHFSIGGQHSSTSTSTSTETLQTGLAMHHDFVRSHESQDYDIVTYDRNGGMQLQGPLHANSTTPDDDATTHFHASYTNEDDMHHNAPSFAMSHAPGPWEFGHGSMNNMAFANMEQLSPHEQLANPFPTLGLHKMRDTLNMDDSGLPSFGVAEPAHFARHEEIIANGIAESPFAAQLSADVSQLFTHTNKGSSPDMTSDSPQQPGTPELEEEAIASGYASECTLSADTLNGVPIDSYTPLSVPAAFLSKDVDLKTEYSEESSPVPPAPSPRL